MLLDFQNSSTAHSTEDLRTKTINKNPTTPKTRCCNCEM